MFHLNLFYHQLEDLEVTVADHIQRVLKPNFGAAWDEVGDEFEKEETFTLSAIKTLEGKEGCVSTAELLFSLQQAESRSPVWLTLDLSQKG